MMNKEEGVCNIWLLQLPQLLNNFAKTLDFQMVI